MDFTSIVDALRTPQGVAFGAVGAGIISYMVMLLRNRDEERRKRMLDVAAKLSSIGFKHLPKILNNLAVLDISGAIRETKALYDILHDKTQRIAELKEVARNIATDLYQDPVYRQEFDDFITELRAKHLPDKASAFASAIDEVADQKSLLEDMKAKLQAAQSKLEAAGAGILQFAPAAAAAVNPAAGAAAAVAADAAKSA
jgi:hypothetical protein